MYGLPPEEIDDLPALSPPHYEFIQALLFNAECEGHAVAAYKIAYPNAEESYGNASRLRRHPNIVKWIDVLTSINLNRLLCSKEEHSAELARLREMAVDTGNLNAAIKAEEARGKVSGHYIDRKEIIHRRDDDLSALIQLAKEGKRTIALEYAADLGLTQKLIEGLDGVYEVEPIARRIPPPPVPYSEMNK